MAEAVAAGMRSNKPESWTGQYAVYAETWKTANTQPELLSDAQLSELNTFMQSLRKADQLYYFSQNPENAKIILTDFLVQFVPGSITREAAAGMSVDDLENLVYSQNEYLRQFLELRYRALTGEETQLTPIEKIIMETDPNGNVLSHQEWENQKPAGTGVYGMWVQHVKDFIKNNNFIRVNFPYTIAMYGRTNLNGVELVRHGAFVGNDPMNADFAGYGKERDGVYNTYWIMKDTSGRAFLHTYIVAVDENNPITIPEGSTVLGGFGTSEDHTIMSGISPELSVTTLFAVDKDAFSEFITQLTVDTLKAWHAWPPFAVKLYPGNIIMPGGVASNIYDPVTGLLIISNEVGGPKSGYIFFGTDFHNPYP